MSDADADRDRRGAERERQTGGRTVVAVSAIHRLSHHSRSKQSEMRYAEVQD